MATRSRIGIQLDDQRVMHVYCHWDGYPKFVGKTLRDWYKKRSQVIELITQGDICSLGTQVWPLGRHNFHTPEAGVCVFYCRDKEPSSSEYMPKISYIHSYPNFWTYADFVYLYDIYDNWMIQNNHSVHADYVLAQKLNKINPRAPWIPLNALKL